VPSTGRDTIIKMQIGDQEGGHNAETKIGKGEASEGTGAAQDWTPAPGSGNPEQEEGPKN
jgi:hypothetical protein